MIARVWTGRTRAEDADAYLAYVEETGGNRLRATPNNRGAWILRRLGGREAEFTVISLWDCEDHVKAFAGEDVLRAVYYPEDERYLLELTPEVLHYEIFGAQEGGHA